MIKIVYGGKGSGKTAQLVAMANQSGANSKGVICFVDKSNNRMHDLDHSVRLVNASTMGVHSAEAFCAFISGMTAVNYDIEAIYIDCIESLTGNQKALSEQVFAQLENLCKTLKVRFVVAVDGERDELPAFMDKYLQ